MSIEVATGLILKLLGSLAGAVLALIFVPPKTRSGFIRRGASAMIAGPIFAPYVQDWGAFAHDTEGLVGAACVAAFVSWWIMGAAKKWIFDRWSIPASGQED